MLSDPFVKVSVVSNKKRIKKKRTETIRSSSDPIWNQELVFDVPRSLLKQITLDISVVSDNVLGNNERLGRLTLGAQCTGDEKDHWNEMLTSKTPMARWHLLGAGS